MTVIDAVVHRSAAENARMGFIVTAVVVTILSTTIASSYVHPVVGLFLGLLTGLVAACLVWAVLRVWPVLRLLWWWTTEILLALTVVYGWLWISSHVNLLGRLLVLTLLVGVPAGVPPIRRRGVALAWCIVVRHRLRVCFSQFIITNRSGSLPLILVARPTPVGERVWIYLRPGLSLKHLTDRLGTIAVACHASMIVAEPASARNAALVRLDIKRRDALGATVGSPLSRFRRFGAPTIDRTPGPVPTALDLTDVSDQDVTDDGATSAPRQTSARTKPPAAPARPAVATAGAADDLDDWI